MKKAIVFTILIVSCFGVMVNAQNTGIEQPKLVVGIVVDQMRADYIYRYWNKLGDKGFKRLLNNGFECRNTQYNYMPTYTGPGHASIYTGTTPAVHGIIGNNWYVPSSGAIVYCASDTTVHAVEGNERSGQMSPRRLLTTTVGDELRLFSNFRSKVIGVSLKDRGAIFPAGHSGTAYWFDNISGNFITSTYYREKTLPDWLHTFNSKKLVDTYLSNTWSPLLDINQYTESTADNTLYENVLDSTTGALPVFNYDLKKLRAADPDLLRRTPFGNTITKDMAMAAIEGEKLGMGSTCDMLVVSFSSTDYVGHAFGTNAIETEDTYLRLDRDLGELLDYIEAKVGKNNVLIFLSADHAGMPNPVFLNDNKLPGGYIYGEQISRAIKDHLQSTYNDSAIFSFYINDQVWLNDKLIHERKLDKSAIVSSLSEMLLDLGYVSEVIPGDVLMENQFTVGMRGMVQRGFNVKRSGDLCIIFQSGYIESYGGKRPTAGTTHGSPYRYDTQVPLIWYGWKIKHGFTVREINITDVAATVSALLNICQPSGCTGQPIKELWEK